MGDWTAVNRRNWDERVDAHVASPEYAVSRFADDPEHLSAVVAFDRPRLGDVAGVVGVHLQCHIGTDTVSLSRLGARMTGVDFSAPAVAAARSLARAARSDAGFVEADVHDAVGVLGRERFGLVYTGVGALCWIPDVDRWAGVVADLLAPAGRLFLREGHPMLWSLDDGRSGGDLVVRFPYFETAEPVVYESAATYVSTDAVFRSTTAAVWNHGLGEVASALLGHGLELTGLVEHDSAPWEALPGMMTRDAWGEWRLTDEPRRLAATYTLQAVKPR